MKEKQILREVAEMMERPGDVAWAGYSLGSNLAGPLRQAADWAYLADFSHHMFDDGFFKNRSPLTPSQDRVRARDIILSMGMSWS